MKSEKRSFLHYSSNFHTLLLGILVPFVFYRRILKEENYFHGQRIKVMNFPRFSAQQGESSLLKD